MTRNCFLNDIHWFKVFRNLGPGRNFLDCQLYPVSERRGLLSQICPVGGPGWWPGFPAALARLILPPPFKRLLIHWPASQELPLVLFLNDEPGTLCPLLRPILGIPFLGCY